MQPILSAIEKVYSGQWFCHKAELSADGRWAFTFVDEGTKEETLLKRIRNSKAVPILRDMLSFAEIHAYDEEAS